MIRSIAKHDIDKIMEIWLKSTVEAHKFIPAKYWYDNYQVVKDMYIPLAETFVYEDEEGIKGFISVIEKEFIGALFVDVKEQGQGIGKALIEEAMKNYKKLTLAVYKENKPAVEFYKKRGFKIIKEQKNEDSGYDEYLMEKARKSHILY